MPVAIRRSVREGTTTVAPRAAQPPRPDAARELPGALLRAEPVLDMDVAHQRQQVRHRPLDRAPVVGHQRRRPQRAQRGAEAAQVAERVALGDGRASGNATSSAGVEPLAAARCCRPWRRLRGASGRRKRLARVAKRTCGPPTAKVEKTCSSSGAGIGSVGGTGRAMARSQERRAVGDRVPAEVALGVGGVELGHPCRASRKSRSDGAGTRRPVARLTSHLPMSSASRNFGGLRVEAQRPAAAPAPGRRCSRARVRRTSPTRL